MPGFGRAGEGLSGALTIRDDFPDMSLDGIKGASAAVEQAIRRASATTGVDFEFLVKTAKRESGFDPTARARTSSAAGLFQFLEQTWLSVVKRHGAKHGLTEAAASIRQGGDGRLRIEGDARAAVLGLRFDPRAAAAMAAELASDHAAYLRGRIGREPTAGELYAAHFLGPAGAAQLVEARESRPGASAASLFPAAARANPGVFSREGRPASVAELYAGLTRTGGSAPAVGVAAPEVVEPANWVRYAGRARLDGVEREQALVRALLGNQSGEGASLLNAQLLGAFVDRG